MDQYDYAPRNALDHQRYKIIHLHDRICQNTYEKKNKIPHPQIPYTRGADGVIS